MSTIDKKINVAKRDIRSYVIREGRMTPGQKKALVDQWTDFGLNIEDGFIDSPFLKPQYQVLEIGFGMGDSLFEMACINPEHNFIGVEVHSPGVGHLLQRAAGEALSNLKVFRADSIDVLNQCIRNTSLDKVQIFFPDPWHKKKHNKRRLITESFVNLLASKVKPNGILHIATDWAPYAEVIEEVMEKEKRSWAMTDIPRRVETKYERRGIKLDHVVADLAYLKTSK